MDVFELDDKLLGDYCRFARTRLPRYGQRTLAMEWTEYMGRIISGPTR